MASCHGWLGHKPAVSQASTCAHPKKNVLAVLMRLAVLMVLNPTTADHSVASSPPSAPSAPLASSPNPSKLSDSSSPVQLIFSRSAGRFSATVHARVLCGDLGSSDVATVGHGSGNGGFVHFIATASVLITAHAVVKAIATETVVVTDARDNVYTTRQSACVCAKKTDTQDQTSKTRRNDM